MFYKKTIIFYIVTFFTSNFFIYALEKPFNSALPNCDDNEKILQIANKTNGEHRIMCIQPEHELYKYIQKHQGHDIKISEKKNQPLNNAQ